MWQSSNTIRAGQMLHIALCCLEGSTPSNQVHRRRRCARIDLHDYAAWRAVRQRTVKVYSCLSPCDGCKEPGGVMVGLTENIQACLRIFRRAQHQWLVRDILHQPQGVFYVFVLLPNRGSRVQGVQKVLIRLIRGGKGTSRG